MRRLSHFIDAVLAVNNAMYIDSVKLHRSTHDRRTAAKDNTQSNTSGPDELWIKWKARPWKSRSGSGKVTNPDRQENDEARLQEMERSNVRKGI